MNSLKMLNRNTAPLPFLFFQLISRASKTLSGHLETITRYAVVNTLFVSAAAAQTTGVLPPRILELVPKNTTLSSQNFTASPTMAVAEFSAEKSVGQGRSVTYSLVIRAFDNSSLTWKMRESAYRKQMEAHVDEHRASLAPESANQGMWTADAVKETKNTWGTGLTQRLLNHPPNASQYVNYQCAYFGMVGGIVFELFVSGIPDNPDEADKWAQDVAQLASKLTVSNIANR